MKSLNIDSMAGPLASSGPQLCHTVKVTGSAGTAVSTGAAVSAGAEVAAGAGAGGLPQALMTMDVTTSRAISMEIVFLFILFSFLSYGVLNG
jgi:hypothetical protein